jgi:hypothetical protein
MMSRLRPKRSIFLLISTGFDRAVTPEPNQLHTNVDVPESAYPDTLRKVELGMAWIGESQGIFRLHDSDQWCGSYLSLADAAEILDVHETVLATFKVVERDGERFVSELDLHRAWSSGRLQSPHAHRIGAASRSLDELILKRLVEIVWPDAQVDPQVAFGRKRVDLSVRRGPHRVLVEFVGPSHFIPQYSRPLLTPLERKQVVEAYFGDECVIWPYWIQRCERNVRALFDSSVEGLAAVWSTKAMFGDFADPNTADMVTTLTSRFNALSTDGIGYMYLAEHTPHKPIHPIINKILNGAERKERLIPKGNRWGEQFWMPNFSRGT